MSEVCFTCYKSQDSIIKSSSSLKARANVSSCINIRVLSAGGIKAFTSNTVPNTVVISGSGSIIAKSNCSFNTKSLKDKGVASIRGNLKVRNSIRVNLRSEAKLNNTYVDKFACSFANLDNINSFQATEKLYPIKDLIINNNNNYFVDKYSNSGNLYSNIDEGVFVGSYTKHGGSGLLISDERQSYIHPSSVFTKGDFKYKCEITRPFSNAEKSFLCIRAAAPTSDYASNIPPQYKIHNIKIEDPSGNLIIKYKDIILRGDADYETDYQNFATYITEPEINNLHLHTWDSNYPFMESASGYSLNLDFNIECLDDPFSEGFNKGYEDTCKLEYVIGSGHTNSYLSFDGSPLATQSQGFNLNPNNSIRISAIEISNSGGYGLIRDSYLKFYSEVNAIGQRNIRNILPVEVITSDTNLDIYPSSNSIWRSSPDPSGNYAYNTSVSGAYILSSRLQDDSPNHYITLLSSSPTVDSGRLTLKFSHKPPSSVVSYSEGAFSFGDRGNAFDTAELQVGSETDNFFVVDSIELKVVAKKAAGTRDYVIDAVGYSDDKLLNVTSKVGAFLQNKNDLYYISNEEDELLVTENNAFIVTSGESIGIVPQVSGFKNINDFGISSTSISNKEQYFESDITSIEAGDHYKLSTLPVINSTTFKEYTIPLQIYKDSVALGKSTDYSISPYFENLYLDLYPIPSGASISTAYLVISYKPSNALLLHTLGQTSDIELAHRSLTLYPSQEQNSNCIVNGKTNQLSVINNIPQAYQSNSGIKSNYARRWRGVDGNNTYGPFNPNEFDFGFYAPQGNDPFNIGYYDLTNYANVSGLHYFWQNSTINVPSTSPYYLSKNDANAPVFVDNFGLRFKNNSLFSSSTDHATIDWTSINGYENDVLYGKISDSFNRAIRLNNSNSLSFDSSMLTSVSGGFAFFLRFSPDINVSGANYNFFNSGILASKWSSGKQLEFVLGYDNGYLTAYAQTAAGNIIKIQDSKPYHEYQYPLPVLLTYNDKNSQVLRLYTDNELENNFNIHRASSAPFAINSPASKSPISICTASSGIGMPMFVTDIGLSLNSCNIVNSGALDRLKKEITAEKLFDQLRMPYNNGNNNHRYSLPLFIDEDTSSWSIGDFRISSFSPAFSFLTKRTGQDFIVHSLVHTGSGYYQNTNITLPSNVNLSGVAYHSQIENDFLRFSLSDINDGANSFYAAHQRIHKNIPRGYNFEEKSIYVETIVEQDSTSSIIWNDGSVGPKLIVSLYTKNQEPIDRPSKQNWGLINRTIHQIEPSGGINKLTTVFNYDDILDISESWARFDLDNLDKEFDHTYLSKDIDDMFLQYDLVYPSGSPTRSNIRIHSANVKLKNAIFKERNLNNILNFVSSGDKYQLNSINLNTFGLDVTYNAKNLYIISDPIPLASSVLNFSCSGAYVQYNSLNAYCHNIGSVYDNLPLRVNGRYNKFDDQILPLITINTFSQPSSYETFNLFVNNRIAESNKDYLNLSVIGRRQLVNYFPDASTNLFVGGEPYWRDTNNNFNLYVSGLNPISITDASINLHVTNYLAAHQDVDEQATLTWNGKP